MKLFTRLRFVKVFRMRDAWTSH